MLRGFKIVTSSHEVRGVHVQLVLAKYATRSSL